MEAISQDFIKRLINHSTNHLNNHLNNNIIASIRYINQLKKITKQNLIVLFTCHLSFAHTVNQINAINYYNSQVIISQNILGVLNLYSIIPAHVLAFFSNKYENFYQFTQLFNHILTDKLYQIWHNLYYYSDNKTNQIDINYNSADYLSQLINYFPSFFLQKNKNINNLSKILYYYFNYSVEIIEYSGTYLTIPEADQLCLTSNQNIKSNQLGLNTILGKSSWNPCQAIIVIIKHISYQEYMNLYQNNSNKIKVLNHIIQSFYSGHINYSLKIKLNTSTFQSISMSNAQLGMNTWLNGIKRQSVITLNLNLLINME